MRLTRFWGGGSQRGGGASRCHLTWADIPLQVNKHQGVTLKLLSCRISLIKRTFVFHCTHILKKFTF